MASRIEQAVARAQRRRSPPARLRGGKGAKLHPKDVPTRTLVRGARVEMEHTRNPDLAVEIALDHIAEDPRYYTKLARMERKAPTSRLMARR